METKTVANGAEITIRPRRHFDLEGFLQACGGYRAAARIVGVSAHHPRRWVDQGFTNTRYIELLLGANPGVNVMDFFGDVVQ